MSTKTINVKTQSNDTVNITVEGENVTIAITKADSDAPDTSGVTLEPAKGKTIFDSIPKKAPSLQDWYNESEQAKKALFQFPEVKEKPSFNLWQLEDEINEVSWGTLYIRTPDGFLDRALGNPEDFEVESFSACFPVVDRLTLTASLGV